MRDDSSGLRENIIKYVEANPGVDSEHLAAVFQIDHALASDLVAELCLAGELAPDE